MATRKKKTLLITPIHFAAIVTSTISLILLVGFFYKMSAYEQVKQDAARIQEKLERVQAEHEQLIVWRDYVQTDEYVERVAREELNWGRPGDTIIRVKTIAPLATSTSPESPGPDHAEPVGPQWTAWFDVFFGQSYAY